MRKLLLNLLALLLLPPGVAPGQKAPIASPKAEPTFELTELQKAHLEAAQQEILRWQDKLQGALQKFSAICSSAQKENKWPPVQCSLTDLAVTPQPAAPPAEAPKK